MQKLHDSQFDTKSCDYLVYIILMNFKDELNWAGSWDTKSDLKKRIQATRLPGEKQSANVEMTEKVQKQM